MQSFIIVSSDKTDQETFLNTFYKANEIDLWDVTSFVGETSIKIEEVKKLQKQLLLKPLRGSSKAFILHNAHLMTLEAQNAFLKSLEEPPAGTYLFLLTNSPEAFLPTIISRCKIITLSLGKITVTEEEKKAIHADFSVLLSGGVNTKLLLAQKIGGDKDTALIWLEKALCYLRELLLQTDNRQTEELIDIIAYSQKTYTIIRTTNVNPRFALEQLFLAISAYHVD